MINIYSKIISQLLNINQTYNTFSQEPISHNYRLTIKTNIKLKLKDIYNNYEFKIKL